MHPPSSISLALLFSLFANPPPRRLAQAKFEPPSKANTNFAQGKQKGGANFAS